MLCTPCSSSLHSLCGVVWYGKGHEELIHDCLGGVVVWCLPGKQEFVCWLLVVSAQPTSSVILRQEKWRYGDCVCLRRSNHTSDLKTGTLALTLRGVSHYRVCAGTGWPVSIL